MGKIAAPKKIKSSKTCIHYWIVEPANAPTSRGICKYCGCERQFMNSFEKLRSATYAGLMFEEKNALNSKLVDSESSS